jgi:hypothetical protein
MEPRRIKMAWAQGRPFFLVPSSECLLVWGIGAMGLRCRCGQLWSVELMAVLISFVYALILHCCHSLKSLRLVLMQLGIGAFELC